MASEAGSSDNSDQEEEEEVEVVDNKTIVANNTTYYVSGKKSSKSSKGGKSLLRKNHNKASYNERPRPSTSILESAQLDHCYYSTQPPLEVEATHVGSAGTPLTPTASSDDECERQGRPRSLLGKRKLMAEAASMDDGELKFKFRMKFGSSYSPDRRRGKGDHIKGEDETAASQQRHGPKRRSAMKNTHCPSPAKEQHQPPALLPAQAAGGQANGLEQQQPQGPEGPAEAGEKAGAADGRAEVPRAAGPAQLDGAAEKGGPQDQLRPAEGQGARAARHRQGLQDGHPEQGGRVLEAALQDRPRPRQGARPRGQAQRRAQAEAGAGQEGLLQPRHLPVNIQAQHRQVEAAPVPEPRPDALLDVSIELRKSERKKEYLKKKRCLHCGSGPLEGATSHWIGEIRRCDVSTYYYIISWMPRQQQAGRPPFSPPHPNTNNGFLVIPSSRHCRQSSSINTDYPILKTPTPTQC